MNINFIILCFDEEETLYTSLISLIDKIEKKN